MRTAFLPLVFAASAAASPIAQADNCSQKAVNSRVRADLIVELKTGQKIYSNLSDADITTKSLDPASLTKVESVKEIIRRVWTGTWTKDTSFSVATLPKEKAYVRDVGTIARMSMVTSFNVMDQVAQADPTFMEGILKSVQNLGMYHTNYISPTGDPAASSDVRARHRTTAGDLMISIRDYHLNYTQPQRLERHFGRSSLSGPSIDDIPNIRRSASTVKLLEHATDSKAKPLEGVSDGKTGYTCNAGYGSYLKYDFNGQSFIVLTLGHKTGSIRDAHARELIETHRQGMAAFAPVPVPIPVMPAAPTQATMTMTGHEIK